MWGYFNPKLLILISLFLTFFPESYGVKPIRFGQFKTTFGFDPRKAFSDEPMLRPQAEAEGFVLLGSGCDDGDYPYPGYHYIQPKQNKTGKGGDVIFIYDGQDKIAGMSSVSIINSPEDPDPTYFQHPSFQIVPGLNGTKYYVSTVYFIPPCRVCQGRSQSEFEEQGTGTGLYLVNGPTIKDLVTVPVYEPEYEPDEIVIFFKAACFHNMGNHYFFHNLSDPNSVLPDCKGVPGYHIFYDVNPPHQLNGFVFQTPAFPPGKRWEILFPQIVPIITGPVFPPCYIDITKRGYKTMHVYLGDYHQTCKKVKTTKADY